MQSTYDLIIVGCGLVGASLALALPPELSIAIIEPSPALAKRPGYLAINLGSKKIWERHGIWRDIAKHATAIRTIEVSEIASNAKTILSAEDVAEKDLGYVIDTAAVLQLLLANIAVKTNVTLINPAHATALARFDEYVQVTIGESSNSLQAKLVIIADGGDSPLRQQLPFELTQKQYTQQIMLAMVTTDKAHHGMAYERFTEDGPVALLPLASHAYNLVWTIAEAEVPRYLAMSDEALLACIQDFYGDRAGRFLTIGTRKIYPLTQTYVKKPVLDRVVLMGNAAHVFHPVGAQGFNLSLKDVANLVSMLRAAISARRDIGDSQLLSQYVASRVDDTHFVHGFTASLLAIFKQQLPLLKNMRQMGLSLFNRSPLAKQAILKRALGIKPVKIAVQAKTAVSAVDYDVVIVGNRLIGAALACTLSSRYNIAIIDKAPSPQLPNAALQARINAYNRASEQLLREIGVWQLLPANRIFPFDKVHVEHEYGHANVSFHAQDCAQSHVGVFIENDLVNYYLHQQLAHKAHITQFENRQVQALAVNEHSIEVTLDDGQCVRAKLLAACDGANSAIRELCGLDVNYHAYHQQCIVGNVEFDGDLDATAWQRFLATGPVGLLPLAKGSCSLAWSCDHTLAQQLMALDDAAFLQALDHAIQGRLGTLRQINGRSSYPLIARHAIDYTAPRTVLLGDAAHVIHPLGGLGANIGFQDVIALAKLLNDPKQQRRDIGRRYILDRYQKQRRVHNGFIMQVMTAFNALFSNESSGLKQLRNVGFRLANNFTPAKKLVLQHAMWMGHSVESIREAVTDVVN